MRAARFAAALGASAFAAGCALPVEGEFEGVSGVARYATRYDHVVGTQANLIDRALANCPEKTVKAESACVRQAVDAAPLSTAALVALVPGCRAGQLCHYDHTTRDRLGFVEATGTDWIKRWRVDLDFRRPAATAAQVPLAVVDRDDFSAPPPAAPAVRGG